jgi:hypothetical protein
MLSEDKGFKYQSKVVNIPHIKQVNFVFVSCQVSLFIIGNAIE